MNAVVFYSNTGQSESVAKFLSQQLCYPLLDVDKGGSNSYKNLVLVFPVHCQNIPLAVKTFLRSAKIDNLAVIATYGKMCYGNVLHEIQRKHHQNIVAAAYLPARHAYVDGDCDFCDFDCLMPVVEKIKNPSKIVLPKSYKNPLSNLFPRLRGRLGLKINKGTSCISCGKCAEHCPQGAIKCGVTNSKCIRCLRCVDICPRHALKVKISLPLRLYLGKKKVNKTVIYV